MAFRVYSILVICLTVAHAVAAEATLADAERLLLTGRYAEAEAAFANLGENESIAAALGTSRALSQQGKYDRAVTLLQAAATKLPHATALLAELSSIAFEQGRYEDAKQQSEKALKLDTDQLLARWIQAELQRTSGDLKAAGKSYEWFVDYYNKQDKIGDPRDLRIIGLAAAQFARWNRLSDQFAFLVNDLFPEALTSDKNFWPAHYESGRLFLEKYNQAEAARSLKAAAAINPNSADVQAALAELAIQNFQLDAARRSIRHALAIHPQHQGAMLQRADVLFANFQPQQAIAVLERARKLNPIDEATRGRLAAAYGMVDGLQKERAGSRMGKMIAEARDRNPHCGPFYFALGRALDQGRHFPEAAEAFESAVEVMPLMVGPRGQLGLMYMRLGDEEGAQKQLDKSFDIDPFNVRVSNSLKVLEVLENYETIETEHFIIRFDGQKDKVFARYAARYLETVYPELCKQLDFEPPEKSLFEIFNQAKNTSGHGWFSARMVGLPNIHTIGACAGKIVALTSPSALKQRFNWARVLKHEFVHVINLQQTNFNIPHWFTEALAVLTEGYPRQPEWNTMLVRRVPKGEVFNLETINMGFIRPSSSEDWQMAYCQAEIYAEYMVERFGQESLGKMLSAYRDNLATSAAIKRALGIEVEQFEKGYTEYLGKIVADLRSSGLEPNTMSSTLTFAELVKAQAAKPGDADLTSQLALTQLRRKSYPEARRMADRVLSKNPKHQLATYVKARLLLVIGEAKKAHDLLIACLDREKPQADVLRLLAGLKYRAEDYQAAEDLYLLGSNHDPTNLTWTKSLAMVYLKGDESGKLVKVLEKLASADADELTVRKKLAQLSYASKDYANAVKWANQSIQIDVMDAAMHRLLAMALVAEKRYEQAVFEYQTAVELQPEILELRMELAKTCLENKDKPQALKVLKALLEKDADHEEATQLLESLNR